MKKQYIAPTSNEVAFYMEAEIALNPASSNINIADSDKHLNDPNDFMSDKKGVWDSSNWAE